MTCPASRGTVRYVEKCPLDEFEWLNAALRKNCSKISQNCSSNDEFLYHCLINSWENATLEVCARRNNIIGKCAEYNFEGAVVQEHMNADCKNFENPCPDVYLSDTAYLCFLRKTKDRKKRDMLINSEGVFVVAAIINIMVVEDASGRRQRNIKNIYGICLKSRETARDVSHCPTTPEEWKKRAELMRCGSIVQSCTRPERFAYHCLPNSFWNKTIEVCAPKKRIVRHKCAEYNEEGTRIQTNFEHCCLDGDISCPVHYSSDESYKYQSCYKLESNSRTTQVPPNERETTYSCGIKCSSSAYGLRFNVKEIVLLSLIMGLMIRYIFET